MSNTDRELQIQVNMLEAIVRLTEEVQRLQQRVEALEYPPSDRHIKGCACHQCLDLQFGWVEPVVTCSMCGERPCGCR